ncbi:DUF3179 domain-containing protein [Lutibaculum baratangense]|uniref:DUF3179 domain-containing protein n=1 Tax=Lutibaculum baratangense AMV1 TaxID=631454 RepID=V4RGZ1_9HYPH|nr:DUF3179 domain-containing protein [Lutibaculum baratangense]ESR24639.1 hypothetical protein N177_2319 [Lutibaculum baratangense AMV1]
MFRAWIRSTVLVVPMMVLGGAAPSATAAPDDWRVEWPRTDFSRSTVDLAEIRSGGPPKDGIPSIDNPAFTALVDGEARGWAKDLQPQEPVISLEIDGDARAYPLRVMMWHEIVNDVVDGLPVAITYCPLCNASLVFDRTVGGRVLDFGTTGKLRHSDLVMYDRQTESWWQQFTGEAIVGEMAGTELKRIPSRLESYSSFVQRHPDGKVLGPENPSVRAYGRNPYLGYDREGATPFLYDGSMPDGIEPMARVVAIETAPGRHEAYPLELVRSKGEIRDGDIVLRWRAGQSSALDASTVAGGRDVGTVIVQRLRSGEAVDLPYDVTFAFAFHAFRPDGVIHRR